MSIRVGNYDVRPSGPHPPGLLKLLCGLIDLRTMQFSLEAVKLKEKYACFSISYNIITLILGAMLLKPR